MEAALPSFVYVEIIQFCPLQEILCKYMLLSKKIRQVIKGENYYLFKKFLSIFTLHKRLKKTDLAAQVDIIDLFKNNMVLQNAPIKRIDPLVY